MGQLTNAAVTGLRPLSGGDVAQSFRVDLDDGRTVFAKTHRNPPPGFFTTEAVGLEWLRAADEVAVPEVIAVSDDPPILILQWIEEARIDEAGVEEAGTAAPDEADFGRALAGLHRAGAAVFGREDRRTTGSRGLPNQPCQSWAEFYASQRLLPLTRLAADANALSGQTIEAIETIAGRLDQLGGPAEPPARLHGDLWAGNRIVDRSGRSWLIDPACHGGHREFDLAMMRLFGGFSETCHGAYRNETPLADGWQDRVPLHQLAPLMVHAIKFGGGYRQATEGAVRHTLG